MNEHVRKTVSGRGFGHMPPLLSTHGGDVAVYESSSARGPHVWISVATEDGHSREACLAAADAWRLAEQLMTLVRDHYQGDARPDAADRLADFVPDADARATLEITP